MYYYQLVTLVSPPSLFSVACWVSNKRCPKTAKTLVQVFELGLPPPPHIGPPGPPLVPVPRRPSVFVLVRRSFVMAAASASTPGVMAAVGQPTPQHAAQRALQRESEGERRNDRRKERTDERCGTVAPVVDVFAFDCFFSGFSLLPRLLFSLLSAGGASIHARDDEFPLLCQTCLGENPLVRMTKEHAGKACKSQPKRQAKAAAEAEQAALSVLLRESSLVDFSLCRRSLSLSSLRASLHSVSLEAGSKGA